MRRASWPKPFASTRAMPMPSPDSPTLSSSSDGRTMHARTRRRRWRSVRAIRSHAAGGSGGEVDLALGFGLWAPAAGAVSRSRRSRRQVAQLRPRSSRPAAKAPTDRAGGTSAIVEHLPGDGAALGPGGSLGPPASIRLPGRSPTWDASARFRRPVQRWSQGQCLQRHRRDPDRSARQSPRRPSADRRRPRATCSSSGTH